MTTATLFCLRAAASRAARRTNHYVACYHRNGSPARLDATVQRECARKEITRFAYLDAACETQRAGLARLAA